MKTVLVVDDNPDIRDLTATVLRNDGFEVREAQNGEEALEVLEDMGDAQPCLILLDLMMPVMDGRTFLTRLQKVGRAAKRPVVVISAAITGAIHGARRLLLKPVSPDALRKVAHEFCGK